MGYASDLLLNLAVIVNLALALSVPFRWGGRLLLCQGIFVGVGAYCVPLVHATIGLSSFLAVPLTGVLGAALGYLFAIVIRRLDPARFAVVTFLFGLAGLEVFENWDAVTGGRTGISALSLSLEGECSSKLVVGIAMVVALAVAMVAYRAAFQTHFGRSIRAARDDPEGALLDGVNPSSTTTEALVLACAHSSIVGALWQFAVPRVLPDYFGFWALSLPVVLACILGGGERPHHILLGSVLVFGLDEASQWLPVPVEVRADIPLLVVGLTYVAAALAGGPEGLARSATRLANRYFLPHGPASSFNQPTGIPARSTDNHRKGGVP